MFARAKRILPLQTLHVPGICNGSKLLLNTLTSRRYIPLSKFRDDPAKIAAFRFALYLGLSEGQVLHLCAYTLANRMAKYSLVRYALAKA